jgi:hypothetical protein
MTDEQTARKLRELDAEIQRTESEMAASDQLLQTDGATGWWSTDNAMTMSVGILLFGVVIIALATYLIRRGTATDSVLKIFGAILIVVSAIFLVVAGYSDQQIAPVIGLLGTIAGYLLGKESAPERNAPRTRTLADR